MHETASRRTVLATACAVGSTFAGGCLDRIRPGPSKTGLSARITDLFVTNLDDRPHTVSFVIERDDEFVYWRTKRVEAKESDGSGTEPAGGVTFQGLPSEPARYSVHGRLDDRDTVVDIRFEEVDVYDAPAVMVNGRVGWPAQEGRPEFNLMLEPKNQR